ncbi:MAG TPA: hypothetical protein VKY45_13665 [Marinilabiliaceae bacterium]|nr:hypothetical protein [Marinilabiliaceae bacterium]
MITILTITTLFMVSIVYLNYHAHFSKAAIDGKVNIENIKKIKVGWMKKRLLKLMGIPILLIIAT